MQPLIFNYALRMLSNREDAEDATQEIMLRIVTHLAGFRFESEFSTWCYSIATNCLLTSRKRRSERHHLSFEEFGLDLGQDLAEVEHHLETLENRLLAEEVKITCTQAMLLCLSREERAAYILGEILGMTDTEAALVCSVQPAAFRKRLSRAREQVRSFTIAHCGWVNPQNPCRCGKRIAAAVRGGRINPDSLEFARRGDQPALQIYIQSLDLLDRTAGLYRSHPEQASNRRWLGVSLDWVWFTIKHDNFHQQSKCSGRITRAAKQ